MERMRAFVEWVQSPRVRRVIIITVACLLTALVIYRFAAYVAMTRRPVFNATRAAVADGAPVNVVTAMSTDGVINVPVAVRNNVARVSATTARNLRAGMKIGDGAIVSVASSVDLDTGLYTVRTRGVADGVNMAQISGRGYYVPAYAVRDGAVFVASDGVALRRAVNVVRSDAESALITSGLNDGDAVIISTVTDGMRVRVMNK